MLKPLNQPRLSPASGCASPRYQQFQYGQSPPQIATSKVLRRVSESASSPSLAPVPAPAPSRQVNYVSRGTQYSPTIQKMDDPPLGWPPGQRPLEMLAQSPLDAEKVPKVVAAPPPLTAVQVPQTHSPALKKRQTSDEVHLAVKTGQAIPTKRVRAAQAPIKVLPLKYEFCDVEDMVILIANMISELIQTNDGLPLRSSVLTRFHSRQAMSLFRTLTVV